MIIHIDIHVIKYMENKNADNNDRYFFKASLAIKIFDYIFQEKAILFEEAHGMSKKTNNSILFNVETVACSPKETKKWIFMMRKQRYFYVIK